MKRFEILIDKWYKEEVIDNGQLRKHLLEVEFDNINSFDQELARLLREKPLQFHPIFEQALKKYY